jgi:hypothetical protein
LKKEEGYFCYECVRKYYPQNEWHFYKGYDKSRKASMLNNATTSFISKNEKGEIMKTRVEALKEIVPLCVDREMKTDRDYGKWGVDKL